MKTRPVHRPSVGIGNSRTLKRAGLLPADHQVISRRVPGTGTTSHRAGPGNRAPGPRGRVQVARVHSGLRKGVRMAIVVLVLWLFTAGAGLSLLVSSNLGRSRPAPVAAEATVAPAAAPVLAA